MNAQLPGRASGCSPENRRWSRARLALLSALWFLPSLLFAADVYPSQPAQRQGLLCVSGTGVTCLDAATMERQWEAFSDSSTFAPLMVGDSVIVGSTSGLKALSASSGAVRWTWPGAGHVFSPVADERTVYVADRGGHVAALTLECGEVLWQRSFDGWLYTPALLSGRVITGGQAGVVRALDSETGETLWKTRLDQELVFRPVSVGDGVVATTFLGSVFRIDATGGIVWTAQDASPSFSPAVAGELLIFGGMDGVLRAREALTGRLRWRAELSGKLSIPASVRGGEVAVVTSDGQFAVVDPGDGEVLGRKRIPGRPLGGPVWEDGWVVFRQEAGIIRRVDASQ